MCIVAIPGESKSVYVVSVGLYYFYYSHPQRTVSEFEVGLLTALIAYDVRYLALYIPPYLRYFFRFIFYEVAGEVVFVVAGALIVDVVLIIA